MPEDTVRWDPEPFRDYLKVLARTRIPQHLRHRLDPSDLVQETMYRACVDVDQCRARNEAQRAAWLRQILAFRLIDELRKIRGPGDAASLDVGLEGSSIHLGRFLAATQPSPSECLGGEELAVEIARRLSLLPEAQAEAVHLRHCEGWPIEAISRHMGRTQDAVGGLLRNGMRKLRELKEESR